MREKVARLLQRGGDTRGLESVRRGVLGVERVEDELDVAVAGEECLGEDRQPRAAPGCRVRQFRKHGGNARCVALVGGVMQLVDAVERAKRIISGVE